MRIYLDSNVFISYIREEIGRNYRPLYHEAEKLFEYCHDNSHTLVLSKLFFEEIKRMCYLNSEKAVELLTEKNLIVERIPNTTYVSKEILQLGIHRLDALHVTTAIENNCDAIATFNTKDFEKVSTKIKIINPTLL